jgi:hypothetical protein
MSKRSPGPKWAMKQSKEKYQAERQRHRDRVARREARTTLSVLGEVAENTTEQEVAREDNK